MNVFSKLRRRILTPSMSQTRVDVRGFHVKSPQSRELLETVGRSFLTGYGYAAEARNGAEAERSLEEVAQRFRGFAYEGAAMGFAIRDGLPGAKGGRVAEFLTGRADNHVYMVYVGVGWAMARLPRFRWNTLYAEDPLLRWLILDGYGFHQAYFKTGKYVDRQHWEGDFPWHAWGYESYLPRVIDQGVGRAMWFVGGTDAARVSDMIARFPAERHADLYAGAGLAATYAGGADAEELRRFSEAAGPYRAQLAQGSAFAAAARIRADLLVPHTEAATEILCGMSAVEAAMVTAQALADLPPDGDLPSYEVWRQRIAATFASVGEGTKGGVL